MTITPDSEAKRHTFGIDICMMHLSGKDIFSVWDFAGQVNTLYAHVYTYTCNTYTYMEILVMHGSPDCS